MLMMRLPASIERKLAALFPRAKDREQFVTGLIEDALMKEKIPLDDMPEAIGGTLHLFTDGGSRGNPGQAAIGCILIDPKRGVTLREHGEAIGIETNNVAEYRALIEGLRLAHQYHPNHLVCHLDSELIVRQISGEYRVKMATLQPLYDEIQELIGAFPDVTFKHIPRLDNFRADALVNKVLDANPSPKFEKLP